jgi:hypothetical protein
MHTIQIPDQLWDLYGGSPEAMRTTLWTAAMNERLADAKKERTTVHLKGTDIIAQYVTTCPVCGKKIEPGTRATMVDWEGGSKAIHAEHAD